MSRSSLAFRSPFSSVLNQKHSWHFLLATLIQLTQADGIMKHECQWCEACVEPPSWEVFRKRLDKYLSEVTEVCRAGRRAGISLKLSSTVEIVFQLPSSCSSLQ